MRKLFNERKLFKGGNYMRKYGRFIGHWKRSEKDGHKTQSDKTDKASDSMPVFNVCIGTIHKGRWQLFPVFLHPLPYIVFFFLLLSIDKC